MTSDRQWDDDGVAIPGTYPISTVSLHAWGEGGKPLPTVTSAICDVCGDWASGLWTSGKTIVSDYRMSDVRVSRVITVVTYACPEHAEQVADALADEFGSASNMYHPDALAIEVTRRL